jgi:hypothetical protein
MQQTIDLTKLSVDELKALAYDCICQVNSFQRNLQTIEQEIAIRKQQQVVPEKEKS